jgi:hypothetical protein
MRGKGRQRSNWYRATLQEPQGALSRLEGREAAEPVVVQIKLDLKEGSGETVSWRRGLRISRARARTVVGPAARPETPLVRALEGEGDPEELHRHLMSEGDPLDPHFADRPHGAEGEPSLEGTGAEGYHTWKSALYVKGRGDAAAIDRNDVKQGGLGDCYLLAALVSVATTDPSLIERMIEDNGDGSYTVHLWDIGPFSRNARLRVEPSFPYVRRGTREVPAFAALGDSERVEGERRYEIWPAVLEKAWAKFKGSYEATEDWHSSGPLSFVSGAPVTNLDPADMDADEISKTLVEAFEEGHPTVLSTATFEDYPAGSEEVRLMNELNLVGFHAYSVVGTTRDGRVRLWNPWGTNHPRRALTGEELKKLCMCAHIGRF